jgi:hypothetical protein
MCERFPVDDCIRMALHDGPCRSVPLQCITGVALDTFVNALVLPKEIQAPGVSYQSVNTVTAVLMFAREQDGLVVPTFQVDTIRKVFLHHLQMCSKAEFCMKNHCACSSTGSVKESLNCR